MQAWRIAQASYAEDLTGQDAAHFGGRWNHSDHRALYFALSPALCALETLVQCSDMTHLNLKLVRVELPDRPGLYLEPAPGDLPYGWDTRPADNASMSYGTAWLCANLQLGLIVPSSILPQACKIVLNPAHLAMNEVRITDITDFPHRRYMGAANP